MLRQINGFNNPVEDVTSKITYPTEYLNLPLNYILRFMYLNNSNKCFIYYSTIFYTLSRLALIIKL